MMKRYMSETVGGSQQPERSPLSSPDVLSSSEPHQGAYYIDDKEGIPLDQADKLLVLPDPTRPGNEIRFMNIAQDLLSKVKQQPEFSGKSDHDIYQELEKRVRYPDDFTGKNDPLFTLVREYSNPPFLLMALEAKRKRLEGPPKREQEVQNNFRAKSHAELFFGRRHLRSEVSHDLILPDVGGDLVAAVEKSDDTIVFNESQRRNLQSFELIADRLLDVKDPSLGYWKEGEKGHKNEPKTYREIFEELKEQVKMNPSANRRLLDLRRQFYRNVRAALRERSVPSYERATGSERTINNMKSALNALVRELESAAQQPEKYTQIIEAYSRHHKKSATEVEKMIKNTSVGEIIDGAMLGAEFIERRSKYEQTKEKREESHSDIIIPFKRRVEPLNQKAARTIPTSLEEIVAESPRREAPPQPIPSTQERVIPPHIQALQQRKAPSSSPQSEPAPASTPQATQAESQPAQVQTPRTEEVQPAPVPEERQTLQPAPAEQPRDLEAAPLPETSTERPVTAPDEIILGVGALRHRVAQEGMEVGMHLRSSTEKDNRLRNFPKRWWQNNMNRTALQTRETGFAIEFSTRAKAALGLDSSVPFEITPEAFTHALEQSKTLKKGKGLGWKLRNNLVRDMWSGFSGIGRTSDQRLALEWIMSNEGKQFLQNEFLKQNIQEQTALGRRYSMIAEGAPTLEKAVEAADEYVIAGDIGERRQIIRLSEVDRGLESEIRKLISDYAKDGFNDGNDQEKWQKQIELINNCNRFLRHRLGAKYKELFDHTELASNIVTVADHIRNDYKRDAQGTDARLESMHITLLGGRAEWGSARGSVNELGPIKFNSVEYFAKKLADRRYGVGDKLLVGGTNTLKDVGLYTAAYGGAYLATGSILARKPLHILAPMISVGATTFLKEGGLVAARKGKIYGIAGRQLHEFTQYSIEQALSRENPSKAKIREAFEKATVDSRTVDELLSPDLLGLLSRQEQLSHEDQKKLVIQLANIKARMRLTDLTVKRDSRMQVLVPQNFIKYRQGEENTQSMQLRAVLMNGLSKLDATGQNDLKKASSLMEAELRMGHKADNQIIGWVRNDLARQKISVTNDEIRALRQEIQSIPGMQVDRNRTLDRQMRRLMNLNYRRAGKAALITAATAPVVGIGLQEVYNVVKDVDLSNLDTYTEYVRDWGRIFTRPERYSLASQGDLSPLQMAALDVQRLVHNTDVDIDIPYIDEDRAVQRVRDFFGEARERITDAVDNVQDAIDEKNGIIRQDRDILLPVQASTTEAVPPGESILTKIPPGTEWVRDSQGNLDLVFQPPVEGAEPVTLIDDAVITKEGQLLSAKAIHPDIHWDSPEVTTTTQVENIVRGNEAAERMLKLSHDLPEGNYWTNGTEKSDGSELRFFNSTDYARDARGNIAVGENGLPLRTVTLDADGLGIATRGEASIDVTQLAKNDKIFFVMRIGGNFDKPIILDAKDGLFTFNPMSDEVLIDPTDPYNRPYQWNGHNLTVGELSKMILNQEALSKVDPGNLASELRNIPEVFNLGCDGKRGLIQVMSMEPDGKPNFFAAIRGTGEVQAFDVTTTSTTVGVPVVRITNPLTADELGLGDEGPGDGFIERQGDGRSEGQGDGFIERQGDGIEGGDRGRDRGPWRGPDGYFFDFRDIDNDIPPLLIFPMYGRKNIERSDAQKAREGEAPQIEVPLIPVPPRHSPLQDRVYRLSSRRPEVQRTPTQPQPQQTTTQPPSTSVELESRRQEIQNQIERDRKLLESPLVAHKENIQQRLAANENRLQELNQQLGLPENPRINRRLELLHGDYQHFKQHYTQRAIQDMERDLTKVQNKKDPMDSAQFERKWGITPAVAQYRLNNQQEQQAVIGGLRDRFIRDTLIHDEIGKVENDRDRAELYAIYTKVRNGQEVTREEMNRYRPFDERARNRTQDQQLLYELLRDWDHGRRRPQPQRTQGPVTRVETPVQTAVPAQQTRTAAPAATQAAPATVTSSQPVREAAPAQPAAASSATTPPPQTTPVATTTASIVPPPASSATPELTQYFNPVSQTQQTAPPSPQPVPPPQPTASTPAEATATQPQVEAQATLAPPLEVPPITGTLLSVSEREWKQMNESQRRELIKKAYLGYKQANPLDPNLSDEQKEQMLMLMQKGFVHKLRSEEYERVMASDLTPAERNLIIKFRNADPLIEECYKKFIEAKVANPTLKIEAYWPGFFAAKGVDLTYAEYVEKRALHNRIETQINRKLGSYEGLLSEIKKWENEGKRRWSTLDVVSTAKSIGQGAMTGAKKTVEIADKAESAFDRTMIRGFEWATGGKTGTADKLKRTVEVASTLGDLTQQDMRRTMDSLQPKEQWAPVEHTSREVYYEPPLITESTPEEVSLIMEGKDAQGNPLGEIHADAVYSRNPQTGRLENRKLTLKDLKEEGLEPKYKIQFGTDTIWVSAPYKADNDGRIAVVGYVPKTDNTGNTTYIARTYYRSNSQGTWRYLPHHTYNWYGKGYSEASINLPNAVQEGLAEITKDQSQVKTVQNPKLVFLGTARYSKYVRSQDVERELHRISMRLNDIVKEARKNDSNVTRYELWQENAEYQKLVDAQQELMDVWRPAAERMQKGSMLLEMTGRPKELRGTFYPRGSGMQPPHELKFSDENQKPVFRYYSADGNLISQPIRTWKQNTELYGEVTMEVWPSQDGTLQYMFCEDKFGRVWIGGIEDVNSPLTSQGIRQEWIDGGNLTTPAFEYQEQAHGYGGSIKKGEYVDMFPNYLRHVPAIKEYLQAKRNPPPPQSPRPPQTPPPASPQPSPTPSPAAPPNPNPIINNASQPLQQTQTLTTAEASITNGKKLSDYDDNEHQDTPEDIDYLQKRNHRAEQREERQNAYKDTFLKYRAEHGNEENWVRGFLNKMLAEQTDVVIKEDLSEEDRNRYVSLTELYNQHKDVIEAARKQYAAKRKEIKDRFAHDTAEREKELRQVNEEMWNNLDLTSKTQMTYEDYEELKKMNERITNLLEDRIGRVHDIIDRFIEWQADIIKQERKT